LSGPFNHDEWPLSEPGRAKGPVPAALTSHRPDDAKPLTGGFRLYGAMKVTFGDPEGPIETATPEHDGSGNVIEISPGHIVSQLQMAKDSPTR
jgi:hypothetical protein